MARELFFIAADGVFDTGRNDYESIADHVPIKEIGNLTGNYGSLLRKTQEDGTARWEIRMVVGHGEPAFRDDVAADPDSPVDEGLMGILNMAPDGVVLVQASQIWTILDACNTADIKASADKVRGGLSTSEIR